MENKCITTKEGNIHSLHAAETSRQLHDGGEGIAAGHGRGQIGHQKTFQYIQNLILSHLRKPQRSPVQSLNQYSVSCLERISPKIPGWAPLPHTALTPGGLHILLCTTTQPAQEVAGRQTENATQFIVDT